MASIINFPTAVDREWSDWEALIRDKFKAEGFAEDVLAHALPRMREHWAVVFDPIDLELPKRPVPGKLTRYQANAIQGVIDAAANVCVERLQLERRTAFDRLMRVELALSAKMLATK